MRKLPFLLFPLLAALGCSGCATYAAERDYGVYTTPTNALGFVSCTGNTPMAWVRLDVADDEQSRLGVIAHETQHVVDIVHLGGCQKGLAAYYANPLFYEARAYCAGFHAMADAQHAPSVEDQIRDGAPWIAASLGKTAQEVTAALHTACYVTVYAPRLGT